MPHDKVIKKEIIRFALPRAVDVAVDRRHGRANSAVLGDRRDAAGIDVGDWSERILKALAGGPPVFLCLGLLVQLHRAVAARLRGLVLFFPQVVQARRE